MTPQEQDEQMIPPVDPAAEQPDALQGTLPTDEVQPPMEEVLPVEEAAPMESPTQAAEAEVSAMRAGSFAPPVPAGALDPDGMDDLGGIAMPPVLPPIEVQDNTRVQPGDNPETYDQARVSTGVTLDGVGAFNDVPERMWSTDQYGDRVSDVMQPSVLGAGPEYPMPVQAIEEEPPMVEQDKMANVPSCFDSVILR